MKTNKLITYNIITFLLILNTMYLFFSEGMDRFSLTSSYLKTIIIPVMLISLLFFMNFLVNYSYIISSAKYKKNMLRTTAIFLMIILIMSIFTRISELFIGKFLFLLWLNTIMYGVLLILVILILKELYKLISKLFEK